MPEVWQPVCKTGALLHNRFDTYPRHVLGMVWFVVFGLGRLSFGSVCLGRVRLGLVQVGLGRVWLGPLVRYVVGSNPTVVTRAVHQD